MNFLKKLVFSIYKPYVARRIYRSSIYQWRDITLFIPAGVFHPKYFFSTKYLLDLLLKTGVAGKSLLELGAGSGLISIACAKNGATVTSSDISKIAISTLSQNAKSNSVELTVIESDLFRNIPLQHFDLIAINPPYYPKQPRNELERAWYCGEHHEYFEQLFAQLTPFLHTTTKVLMVLSEDCNLDTIFSLAHKNKINLQEISRKKFWWEWNMIYQIQINA